MKIIFIVVFAIIRVYCQPDVEKERIASGRIIGGYEVRPNQYPFVVRIISSKSNNSFLCGASLLQEYYVVTAAHCVFQMTSLILYFGDHNLEVTDRPESSMEIPIRNVRVHSLFNNPAGNNDIALIKLPQRAPLSSYVRPICVASVLTERRYWRGTAIGWGLTKNRANGGQTSPVLKSVSLPLLWYSDCGFGATFNKNTMLCAGYTTGIQASICFGDSGGPLVIGYGTKALTGISSFVSISGCVTRGFGSVFVRVSSFIPWLRSNMDFPLCVL